jgi:hypothetical protein
MEVEYMPGDIVPVTSSLYRVVHDPPGEGEQLKTFHAGQRFPPCSECGKKVRYVLPSRVLRKKISNLPSTDFGACFLSQIRLSQMDQFVRRSGTRFLRVLLRENLAQGAAVNGSPGALPDI